MTREWADRYVGIPFVSEGRDRTGLDCWGLVALVYRNELGIVLPAYGEISAFDLVRIAREVSSACDGAGPWRRCEPKPMAVAVMTATFTGERLRRAPVHVGVFLDSSRILHAEANTDSCIVRASDRLVAPRMLGVFEYAA